MNSIIGVIFSIATGMIGYTIHGSIFWSILDGIFSLVAWGKWLICHEVTFPIIKETFSWLGA